MAAYIVTITAILTAITAFGLTVLTAAGRGLLVWAILLPFRLIFALADRWLFKSINKQ